MATLTGQTIAATYDALLKVTDNGPITSSLKLITDGLGNNTALSLSNAGGLITGTFSVSSTISASNLSGTNTGDETNATIKTKLGAATTSVDGYLTSTDWNTFNNKVPASRTLTINGTAYDLSADRSWTIVAGVSSFNTRTGAITLTSLDVTDALGFTPVTNARTISTTAPLSGGGDLTANRTLSISQATTSTDGYLSSTDWNTFNGKVAGSGTTNYISKFTSSSAIGNSLIYNDANSVLINDTFNIATNYKLQVTGDIYTSGSIAIGSVSSISTKLFGIGRAITGATTAYGITFEGNIESTVTTNGIVYRSYPIVTGGTLSAITHYIASKNAFIGGSTVTNQYGFFADASVSGATNNYGFYGNIASATGAWNLYMNGTAQNYINGNLGIGVAVPTVKLDVSGAGLFSSSVTASSFIKSGGTSAQLLAGDGSVVTAGTNITIAGGTISSSAGLSGSGTTNYVAKFTGTSAIGNSLIFDNGTNVGIGTTSPTSKLYIAGDLDVRNSFSYFGSVKGYTYIVDDQINSYYSTDADAALNINFAGYNNGLTRFRDLQIWNGKGSQIAIFKGSNGNVGIGTTTPSNKLQVFGSTDSYLANFTGSSGGATARGLTIGTYTSLGGGDCGVEFNAAINNNGFGQFRFSAGSNERMRIDSSGNVGIGTASPTTGLVVNSRIQVTGNTAPSSGTGLELLYDGTSAGSLAFARGTGYIPNFMDGSQLQFLTSSSERMRITSAGNVGIGTSSPGVKLDVIGALNVTSDSTEQIVIKTLTNTNRQLLIGYNYTPNYSYIQAVEQGVAYRNLILQQNGGNVGIGTTSPGANLEVVRSSTGTVASFGINGQTINPRLRIDADESNNTVTLNPNYSGSTSPALVFKTQEVERMRILAGGSVGIGTTSPATKFHVYGGNITIDNPSGTDSQIIFAKAGVSKYELYYENTGNSLFIYDRSSSAYRFFINSSGNVGIGTSSPSYKLDVAGGINYQNQFNRQTASYTLVLADASKIVETNVGSANNLTVPLNSSVAFPIGTEIAVLQYGSGQTTIVATGGVTLRSKSNALKISGQFAGCTLVKVGTDEWYVVGDLTI